VANKKANSNETPPAAPVVRFSTMLARDAVAAVLVGVALFTIISILTFDARDLESYQYPRLQPRGNWCNWSGANLVGGLYLWLGYAAFALVMLAGAWGIVLILGRAVRKPLWRTGGAILLVISCSAFFGILDGFGWPPMDGMAAGPGGLAGLALASALTPAFGKIGVLIGVAVVVALSLLLATDMLFSELWRHVRRTATTAAAKVRRPPAFETPAPSPTQEERLERLVKPAAEAKPGAEAVAPAKEPAKAAEEAGEKEKVEKPEKPAREKKPRKPVKRVAAELPKRKPAPAASDYPFPPPDLLLASPRGQPPGSEQMVKENARVLERTLDTFDVPAEVVSVTRGPVVTQYEMALAEGIKVHRVMALADDIAMALKASSVRIVAPIPGRSTVGVEVPNEKRDTVRLRDVMEADEMSASTMAIPLFLGKDTAGAPLTSDMAEMPHLLIAGATGAGKSVCINGIITSIIATRSPADVQMILLDPKMVELAPYEELPHLLCPVVTDMKKAPGILEWACRKMDERYEILSRAGVRDINGYNALGQKEVVRRLLGPEEEPGDDFPFHMPYLVIVIDELADLMLIAAKEVESSIIRLAQKSRAVGIHLLVATQRPSVDVVTGLIKANLPARISFRVSSKVDSRTILDQNGAEKLLGQGDMLFLMPGTANISRAQGSLLTDDEIKRTVGFLKEGGQSPNFDPDLDLSAPKAAVDPSERDDLYEHAVRIVLETRRGSVSLLQRHLQIGYTRAARLVDMMAEAGLVGAYKGSQAREVLMELDEWEEMRGEDEDDAGEAT
jgi:S-DNA-T family DNA segregation ATPase FtsK/SpoIIIE